MTLRVTQRNQRRGARLRATARHRALPPAVCPHSGGRDVGAAEECGAGTGGVPRPRPGNLGIPFRFRGCEHPVTHKPHRTMTRRPRLRPGHRTLCRSAARSGPWKLPPPTLRTGQPHASGPGTPPRRRGQIRDPPTLDSWVRRPPQPGTPSSGTRAAAPQPPVTLTCALSPSPPPQPHGPNGAGAGLAAAASAGVRRAGLPREAVRSTASRRHPFLHVPPPTGCRTRAAAPLSDSQLPAPARDDFFLSSRPLALARTPSPPEVGVSCAAGAPGDGSSHWTTRCRASFQPNEGWGLLPSAPCRGRLARDSAAQDPLSPGSGRAKFTPPP